MQVERCINYSLEPKMTNDYIIFITKNIDFFGWGGGVRVVFNL